MPERCPQDARKDTRKMPPQMPKHTDEMPVDFSKNRKKDAHKIPEKQTTLVSRV